MRYGANDDPYTTLGVSRENSIDEIKAAFRKLAHKHHPDHGGGEEVFKKISGAYTFLLKTHVQRAKGSAQTYDSGKPVAYEYDAETGMWWSPHEVDKDGYAVKEIVIAETDEDFKRRLAELRSGRIGKKPPPTNAREEFRKRYKI